MWGDLELQVCLLVKPDSLLPTGFPWRPLCTLVPLSWHPHTHQWRWVMLMRAYSSAVPIGQPFFSLLQDRCFLVKGVGINESGLAQEMLILERQLIILR